MSFAPEEPGVVKLPPHLLLAPTYATARKFIQTELGGPWTKVDHDTAVSASNGTWNFSNNTSKNNQ